MTDWNLLTCNPPVGEFDTRLTPGRRDDRAQQCLSCPRQLHLAGTSNPDGFFPRLFALERRELMAMNDVRVPWLRAWVEVITDRCQGLTLRYDALIDQVRSDPLTHLQCRCLGNFDVKPGRSQVGIVSVIENDSKTLFLSASLIEVERVDEVISLKRLQLMFAEFLIVVPCLADVKLVFGHVGEIVGLVVMMIDIRKAMTVLENESDHSVSILWQATRLGYRLPRGKVCCQNIAMWVKFAHDDKEPASPSNRLHRSKLYRYGPAGPL